MSDDDLLRSLEREAEVGAWRERAALIEARARCGLTSMGMVELAAFAGDAASQSLLPEYVESDHVAGVCRCGDCLLKHGTSISEWVFQFSRWGDEWPLRAAVAGAQLVATKNPDLSAWHACQALAYASEELMAQRPAMSGTGTRLLSWSLIAAMGARRGQEWLPWPILKQEDPPIRYTEANHKNAAAVSACVLKCGLEPVVDAVRSAVIPVALGIP